MVPRCAREARADLLTALHVRQVSQYEGERFSVVYFRSHGKLDAPLRAVHLPLEIEGAGNLHGVEEEEKQKQSQGQMPEKEARREEGKGVDLE